MSRRGCLVPEEVGPVVGWGRILVMVEMDLALLNEPGALCGNTNL